MGFIPTKAEEGFWFFVSPITTIPMLVYASAGYASGYYPYGKPDFASSVRNAMGWGAIAAAVHGYNLLFSSHNAAYMSGRTAFTKGAQIAFSSPATVPAALIALATASAVGYVATSDVHMGATGMLVGDMNMGLPLTTESGGSSSNIFPGLSEHSLWPWNW